MAKGNRSTVVGLGPNDHGPERVTQYNELHYQRQGAGNWRLIDTSTGATIGPNYPSEKTLLADLQRQYESRFFAHLPPARDWLDVIRDQITEIANHYAKSAPTVCDWANDLYIRINDAPDRVPLTELLAVSGFRENDQWEQANFAANRVYKLLHRLGRDTTGMAGF